MYNILLIIQIIVAIGIIGLVLVQHGKGADAGAAFGGGASGSVFGARGAGNFLSRTTAILALVFFLNSMGLAWLVSHRGDQGSGSVVDSLVTTEESVAPAETAPGDVPDAPEAASPQAESTSDVPAADDVPSAASESEDVPEAPATPATADVPEAESSASSSDAENNNNKKETGSE